MTLRFSFLFVFLCVCSSIFSNNGIPTNPSVSATAATDYPLDKIFYNDFENHYVFVDFETITDDLVTINLWRADKLMMEDDVTDLPGNAIYEFNTDLFRSGDYTIELVTLGGVKIHKIITIE